MPRFTPAVARTTANLCWNALQALNTLLPRGKQPHPRWAPRPLLRSDERATIPLGLPRETQSLCPGCVWEKRASVLSGSLPDERFHEPGELIPAQILEEAGRVVVRKTCDKHEPFEDVLSDDPAFFRRMESLYQGHDFACTYDEHVHHHGASSIRFGRGGFLVFDLTNRCNMRCSPCFMDANALAQVNEWSLEQIRAMLRQALSFKPRREINILFSGGEPTLSPNFLDAVRYARELGFKRLHVATNGIRFAEEEEFAKLAKEAGLHSVYLQLDGVTEGKNEHRGVENLFEVKLRALENIANAGMRSTLQVTVINGLNNEAVGAIADFAARNLDKVEGVLFQPIMFSGRDEQVDDKTRRARRYPLSKLVQDLSAQARFDWQPMRDWVPVSAYNAVSRIIDLLRGPGAEEGAITPDAHPDFAISCPLLVNRRTGEVVPLGSFFDMEKFCRDAAQITDSARGPMLTKAQLALSVVRNIRPAQLPGTLGLRALRGLLRQGIERLDSGAQKWGTGIDDSEWMWMTTQATEFQDLYLYDVQNAQSSPTPVATPDGEIDFSAYNGAGWRQVIEARHRTATLPEWHREHGRHQIYAHGKLVALRPGPAETPAAIPGTDASAQGRKVGPEVVR